MDLYWYCVVELDGENAKMGPVLEIRAFGKAAHNSLGLLDPLGGGGEAVEEGPPFADGPPHQLEAVQRVLHVEVA